jgi:hypothetical protein
MSNDGEPARSIEDFRTVVNWRDSGRKLLVHLQESISLARMQQMNWK